MFSCTVSMIVLQHISMYVCLCLNSVYCRTVTKWYNFKYILFLIVEISQLMGWWELTFCQCIWVNPFFLKFFFFIFPPQGNWTIDRSYRRPRLVPRPGTTILYLAPYFSFGLWEMHRLGLNVFFDDEDRPLVFFFSAFYNGLKLLSLKISRKDLFYVCSHSIIFSEIMKCVLLY